MDENGGTRNREGRGGTGLPGRGDLGQRGIDTSELTSSPRPSAVVGSAVAVMPWARWAACIGGGVWGVFVAVAHVRYAQKDMRFVVPRFQKGLDGIIGLITGAVHGALFGIMAVAFIGAVLGGIVGLRAAAARSGKEVAGSSLLPRRRVVRRSLRRGSPGVLHGPCRGDHRALVRGFDWAGERAVPVPGCPALGVSCGQARLTGSGAAHAFS